MAMPSAQRLQVVLSSRSWRVGSKATAPLRKLRSLLTGSER